MNLYGNAVVLRGIEREDLRFLRDLHNDPEVEQWLIGWSFPLSMFDQEAWLDRIALQKNAIRLIIEERATQEVLGYIGLWQIDWKNSNAEVGIALKNDPRFRGKGYATDAMATIMRFAFNELGLQKLWGDYIEGNTAAVHFLSRCGWLQEGLQIEQIHKCGEYRNRVLMRILKSEYQEFLSKKGIVENE